MRFQVTTQSLCPFHQNIKLNCSHQDWIYYDHMQAKRLKRSCLFVCFLFQSRLCLICACPGASFTFAFPSLYCYTRATPPGQNSELQLGVAVCLQKVAIMAGLWTTRRKGEKKKRSQPPEPPLCLFYHRSDILSGVDGRCSQSVCLGRCALTFKRPRATLL